MSDTRTALLAAAGAFCLVALAARFFTVHEPVPLPTAPGAEAVVEVRTDRPEPLQLQRVEAGQPVEQPPAVLPSEPCAEVLKLRERVLFLERRLRVMESGTVREWQTFLRPGEEPEPAVLKMMTELLADYPVHLRVEEGLWLAERVKRDDWLSWGRTIDDAIFTFLGEERLRSELTPEQFAAVKPE